MPTIDIIIRNKTASAVNPPCIVCGNSDYNVKFDFDEEWQAHNNKIGVFAYNRCGEWQSEKVLFEGDTCPVPALHGVRSVWIGVTAGDVRTSTPADVPCRMGATDFSDTTEKPSADIWGQILDKLDSIGTGGATPDWAQNDPNGAGYIKNRCGGYDDVQTRESELRSLSCPADKNTAMAFNGESILWFGTQNPSSITNPNAFFASDKWLGGFKIDESDNNEMAIVVLYGALSEFVGKTVGLKQRGLSVTPVKISRRYLDVDAPAIKITEKGAIYSPSITDDGSSLGAYAVNLGKGKGGATGNYSFTTGQETVANGYAASSFGTLTRASGRRSAAFGDSTTASGANSAAFGEQTSATKENQFVCGEYNDETIGKNYLFVVGSGKYTAKKNGFAVTAKGEIVLPDPNATSTRYMKARFNSDGTITLIPLADETKSYTTECTANRVTAITAESTDAQYPTAKAVYDAIQAAIASLNNTGE